MSASVRPFDQADITNATGYNGEETMILMTKDTSVNFINRTEKTLRIKSASDRFNAFNLDPGEQVRVTDSFGGRDNYDIDADILINPDGPNNSSYLGNIKFDNPFIGEPSARTRDFWYAEYLHKKDWSKGRTDDATTYSGIRFHKDRPVYRLDTGELIPKKTEWKYIDKDTLLEWKNQCYCNEDYPNTYTMSARGLYPAWDSNPVEFNTFFYGSVGDQMRWDIEITRAWPVS